ncbi:MAG: beta-N-acetylhexosaminidase [Clostridiales bacterium]|jgi:hexosaminidase|nr:beta-N-acetylhexosaminidase [Clostridiales bacterium]
MAITPKINGSLKESGDLFTLPKDRLSAKGATEKALVLAERLQRLPGYENLELAPVDSAEATLEIAFAEGPEGGYKLKVEQEKVTVEAYGEEGAANALATLYWMLRDGKGTASGCEIIDIPECGYRGFEIDSSRHFFDTDTVKSMIEQLSLRKMNRLHWHLSDDQGYRVESKAFPSLNSISSYRIEEDGNKYGGYYTQEQIKEIVSYAKARGIEIIPEIDVPGHVVSILAAYPNLSCRELPIAVTPKFGVMKTVFCAGKDEALDFAIKVIDEVAGLFPFEYFHTGGDEVPKDEWKACPHCQERIKKEVLADEEELQSWFAEKIIGRLRELGKTSICWNDALVSGKQSDDIIIQYWREQGTYCSDELKKGRKWIYSCFSNFYLDYTPDVTPLRTAFAFKPVLNSGELLTKETGLLGFEAELWSEWIPTKVRLEQMAFPRIFALADRAWNGSDSYVEFLERCNKEVERLREDGIACFSMEEADPE